jgi:hypothetical protein
VSKAASSEFVGKWRITGMETWDAEYVDMEVSAFITIRKDLTGEFQFGLVRAELDGRIESAGTTSRLSFSWAGFEELDPSSGRGWLEVTGAQAEGRIFIHLADESGFTAKRMR